MCIVDNSPFSSIAPEQKKAGTTKGGMKSGIHLESAKSSTDEVKDVKSFLQIGASGASKRKPMVIRVYNHKNRGITGEIR